MSLGTNGKLAGHASPRLSWTLIMNAAALLLLLALTPETPDAVEGGLTAWYETLGPPRSGESFGHYLARAARIQHGKRYEEAAQPPPGVETLRIDLDEFECVTFIESSLAVARCGFEGTPTRACFEQEIIASRYRGGALSDYASRLHYFTDWIDDNAGRGRLTNLTPALGGQPTFKRFFRISQRELPRGAVSAETAAEVARVESRLSESPHFVLSRELAPAKLSLLEDGDLIAFVRERPGLLVHHAGFILRVGGVPHLLHASSFHKRVVITAEDVTDYLLRRPERRGVIVARPTPPRAER